MCGDLEKLYLTPKIGLQNFQKILNSSKAKKIMVKCDAKNSKNTNVGCEKISMFFS